MSEQRYWNYLSLKAQEFGRIEQYELTAAMMLHFNQAKEEAWKNVARWVNSQIETSSR